MQSDIQKRKLLRRLKRSTRTTSRSAISIMKKYSMPRPFEASLPCCAEAAEHGTKIGFELMPLP